MLLLLLLPPPPPPPPQSVFTITIDLTIQSYDLPPMKQTH
jgi:hypothetical protein